jgi:hypothetical protein
MKPMKPIKPHPKPSRWPNIVAQWNPATPLAPWWQRLLWLVLIYSASISLLLGVAWLIRLAL